MRSELDGGEGEVGAARSGCQVAVTEISLSLFTIVLALWLPAELPCFQSGTLKFRWKAAVASHLESKIKGPHRRQNAEKLPKQRADSSIASLPT